jgi:hypothetical protein
MICGLRELETASYQQSAPEDKQYASPYVEDIAKFVFEIGISNTLIVLAVRYIHHRVEFFPTSAFFVSIF